MATYAENLITLRDNTLAALNTAILSPKPSYSNGPRSVSWNEWLRILQDQLDKVNELIGQSEPIEVTTIVRPGF